MPLEPTSPQEVAEMVRAHARVLPFGGQTKPRLSGVAESVTGISTQRLSGITEYDSREFTFTALAGTPVRDIAATLAREGQYLPFDPLLMDAGATIGGTVASGLNGPGRLRFGGIRDFILAAQFVDGAGTLLRGGAKVVKNAAGFDFPKFLVGSLGRFSVITEVSFKVFPRPASWLTLCLPVRHQDLAQRLSSAALGRWELDALEYDAHEGLLYARLGGPAEANEALAKDLQQTWTAAVPLSDERAASVWEESAELTWAANQEVLLKAPITLKDIPAILGLDGAERIRISGGGSSAWVAASAEAVAPITHRLKQAGLSALTIRGANAPLLINAPPFNKAQHGVQRVFDPSGRFGGF